MKDFNFAGGLTPNLNKLFEQHAKKHGLIYGTGAGHQILKNVRTSKDLRIDVLQEDDPRQHLMKVGVILGASFGFRGGKEHADLLVEHLQVGTFEIGHELEGTEYYSLAPKEDKTTKLTTTNPVLQKSKYTRIPIGDKTHPSSPGGTIWRYLKKIGPGQICF